MLLVSGNGEVHSGDDYTAKTHVLAEVAGHGRAPKIIVFKYKPKVRYRRKRGHRQDYTELFVREIVAEGKTVAGASQAEPKPKRASARKQKEEIAEGVAEIAAGAGADAPEQEIEAGPAPKPRRGRKAQVAAVAEGALADAPEAQIEDNAARAGSAEEAPKPARSRKKKES